MRSSDETGRDARPAPGKKAKGSANGGSARSSRSMWGSVWTRLAVTAFVLAAAYVGLVFAQGDRLPAGTSIAGVDVGGLSPAEARTKFSSRAAQLERDPVTVQAGDARFEVVPASSGLTIDVDRSLAGFAGRSFNPATVLERFSGGKDHAAAVDADRSKLATAARSSAAKVLAGSPKEGKVGFDDGRVETIPSSGGEGIDGREVADSIAAGWPATRNFSAKIARRDPVLSNAEIDRFVKDVADPAVSGDLTVRSGSASTRLTPRQVSPVLSVRDTDGKLSLVVDADTFADLVLEQEPGLQKAPRNAKVGNIEDGKNPSIVPAVDGTEIDRAKLAAAVAAGLRSPEHVVTLPTKSVKAEVTQDDLSGIDTTTQISEFRSPFPGGASNRIRTQNMRVALAAIDGSVVAKGEQFSLIDTLGGELTPDKGYGAAPTIQGGKERAAQGGGVSQVSTALYNAAFFAGVQLDEHKAHSFWIKRYPAGREATLWVPKIDNTWTNDTDAPIVVRGKIEGDEVVVSFYGKRKYTVTEHTGEKYNIRQPRTIRDDHPGCLPVPTNIGFDIDVTRTLKQGDRVVRTEKTTTKYNAADRVICG